MGASVGAAVVGAIEFVGEFEGAGDTVGAGDGAVEFVGASDTVGAREGDTVEFEESVVFVVVI